MIRQELNDALKVALKARDVAATGTLRLILAALKDRDIAARGRGQTEGIDDAQIIEMMQKMVRQRQESIEMYEKGNRPDLVALEKAEIAVIERYLPQMMTSAEMDEAIARAIDATGAAQLKDMGKVMNWLKQNCSGRMDFGQAGQRVKSRLG
ncbi:MAG TPA: GatB/YqeY domain-containing protein [Dongiaceae bacterium]|jgi:hypothetical protein|nr:GatB/YqeY domain-containing protein [Dongiaceae bacterium]